MENTELLERLLAAIEQSNDALRKEILEGQETLRKEIIDQATKAMSAQSEMIMGKIDQKVYEAETRINIKIEHEIDRQLKALFDGYQLNYDKNMELVQRTEKLDSRVQRLEIRMDILEGHKTA